MAIHIYCYSSLNKNDTEVKVNNLLKNNKDIFPSKFLLSKIINPPSYSKEVALEHGLYAESCFLVRINDKDFAHQLNEVIYLIKSEFNKDILIMNENSQIM